jgi:hypothetical protein
LTTFGINRNPDSSTKTRGAPSRAAFFYPRPVFLLPALDGLLVALHRATLGFLVAPIQAVHQPPDMIPMIVDSELALDQHRNSCCRPKIGAVALGHRSLEQQFHQAPALGPSQLQRAPGRRANAQGVRSASPPRPEPPQHGTGSTLDSTPDFVQRQTLIAQGQRSSSAILQQIGAPLQSGHRCSLLKDSLLHYLCRSK